MRISPIAVLITFRHRHRSLCSFNSSLVQVHEIRESSQRRAQSDEASSCLIDGERKALVALPSLTGRSVAMEVYLVAEKRGKLRMSLSLSNSSNFATAKESGSSPSMTLKFFNNEFHITCNQNCLENCSQIGQPLKMFALLINY